MWLFATQYFIWDQFAFGALLMKLKICGLIFSLVFYTKLIYWLNMSFSHHICSCLIFVLVIIASFNISHNWLGSLHDIFWLLTIVWSNCEEVIVYSWRWQNHIYRISCWTFIDPNRGEGYFPYKPSLLSPFIWEYLTASFGAGALLLFCAWSDQFFFTNKWLRTIPIIQPSKFVSTKDKTI